MSKSGKDSISEWAKSAARQRELQAPLERVLAAKEAGRRGGSGQSSLFSPIQFDLADPVRLAISRAVRGSRHSIEEIAAFITARAHPYTPVTRHILYGMSAQSHTHRFPLEWLTAFCYATGDFSLLRLALESFGPALPDLLALIKAEQRAEKEAGSAEALRRRILCGEHS